MVDAKRAALLALVVQNTLLVLTMRYSRTRPGPMYLASTAVVVDEALKATVCVAALLWQWSRSEQRGGAAAFLRREVCERPAETMKMAVVAGLYTLQKNALYVAVSNLDAAVFQLTYQAKNLTTALFTCILLGRTFTRQQLGALVVLTGGVAAIQVDAVHGGSGEAVGDHHERECSVPPRQRALAHPASPPCPQSTISSAWPRCWWPAARAASRGFTSRKCSRAASRSRCLRRICSSRASPSALPPSSGSRETWPRYGYTVSSMGLHRWFAAWLCWRRVVGSSSPP